MPSNRRIGGRPANLVPVARLLRHEMTPAERQLWAAPRRHQLAGLHIRRQHPIGPFVVDFACAARRLAIEVDGDVHAERTAQDAARTEILEQYGWRMLRFRNDEVIGDLVAVLARIEAALVTTPSLNPSPNIGGGSARQRRGGGHRRQRK